MLEKSIIAATIRTTVTDPASMIGADVCLLLHDLCVGLEFTEDQARLAMGEYYAEAIDRLNVTREELAVIWSPE